MQEILTTVLLLNPVYVTLFWAIVLNFSQREPNAPRMFLGKFMIVAFVLYLSHFFYFQRIYSVYIWIDSIYNFASLSVYPMYYIYARLLTKDEKFEPRYHLRYLIAPAVGFLVITAGYLIMDEGERYSYMTGVLYGESKGGASVSVMYRIYIFERVLFFCQMILYVIMTSRLIMSHHRQLSERYSFTENISLKWVQVFNITLFLTSAMSAYSIGMGRDRFIDRPMLMILPSLVFSILLFIIGALGSRQRAVIISEFEETEPEELTDDKIPIRLKDDLIALFEKRHVYLDKDLTIWDLTEKLGTNRTYVSKIINKDFGLTFTVFVNNYRVDHAIRLLNGHKHYTVEDVAEMSGFGSANSLYRAFLAKEGISLTQYRSGLPNNNRH